eukprot:UN27132
MIAACLPLRYLAIFSGVCLFLAGLVDFMVDFHTAADFLTNLYLMFFGFLIFIIETKQNRWNKSLQDSIFYWALFLQRYWGRAFLYIFLGILCMSDTKHWWRVVLSLPSLLIAIGMYSVSYRSAKKLNRINQFISQGFEGEEQTKKISAKFHEIVPTDFLLSVDIIKLSEEANRDLTSTEADCIMRFFDVSLHVDYQ